MTTPEQSQYQLISKKTVLIIAEGLMDSVFLKYIKSLYIRPNKLSITIRNGGGGSADSLVKQALNSLGYDKRIAVIDNDKKKSEMEKARKLAIDNNIKLIESTPCIEATFLEILCDKQEEIPNKTGGCKLKYKKDFLDNKKIEDSNDLLRMFPKRILNSKRKIIPILDEIISIIEGKL